MQSNSTVHSASLPAQIERQINEQLKKAQIRFIIAIAPLSFAIFNIMLALLFSAVDLALVAELKSLPFLDFHNKLPPEHVTHVLVGSLQVLAVALGLHLDMLSPRSQSRLKITLFVLATLLFSGLAIIATLVEMPKYLQAIQSSVLVSLLPGTSSKAGDSLTQFAMGLGLSATFLPFIILPIAVTLAVTAARYGLREFVLARRHWRYLSLQNAILNRSMKMRIEIVGELNALASHPDSPILDAGIRYAKEKAIDPARKVQHLLLAAKTMKADEIDHEFYRILDAGKVPMGAAGTKLERRIRDADEMQKVVSSALRVVTEQYVFDAFNDWKQRRDLAA
jgi:hypothetical protein